MNRMFLLTGALALAVFVSSSLVQAEDKKETGDLPSISEIMKSAHGEAGPKSKVAKALAGEDWDAASSAAKDWVKQAESLGKNKPTKGTPASWKKLTGTYEKNVKALAAASEKKDADKAKAAMKALNSSCGSCHGAHKPKK